MNEAKAEVSDGLTIVLAGAAGQGIQVIESIITELARRSGFHVFATKEYMSRVRGGVNATTIRVSVKQVSSLCDRVDLFIPLSPDAVAHMASRTDCHTVIAGDPAVAGTAVTVSVPFGKTAADLGNSLYENSVAAGLIAAVIGIAEADAETYIGKRFEKKGADVSGKNKAALKAGYALGVPLAARFSVPHPLSSGPRLMLSGADAVALGALAAGCDYVCGYPMSPATGVLERMASYSLRHDMVVEQVEDEVGVINMALGASYAGARSFVSTSGGGFALMTEGISLCGMIETPVVVHLAQRPSPATGLPTRTEQGDLNLVRYAGHGDFPRVILAPGTLEQGFTLTAAAFDLADTFQIPAFILTDEYFVDTYYDTAPFSVTGIVRDRHIVKTDESYRRFAVTGDGISPRGVPGWGAGIVCVDSDEHSEAGYIIEDAATRVAMCDKRMKKNEALLSRFIPPLKGGAEYAETVVISWGSTYPVVRDALALLGDASITHFHFSWLYPLPDLWHLVSGAVHVIVVENNVTGQFASLLESEARILVTDRIVKYDGRPFTVEELAARIGVVGKERG
jgi:2-oxoglutarate/2-oxoacid ferredoxin oxidoreductase subunit alpha